jgi:biopolymer transport protein ExbD
MAEMNVPDKGGKGGKRAKKASTRVDLTAMVDLGFLLITFFMLATTMNKPKTMEINKPEPEDKKDKPADIKMSKTLTLMLGSRDKAYWYVSPDKIDATTNLELDSIDYSPNGVRRIVKRRQKEVQEQWGDKKELFVMIKPLPGSKLRNTVDVLDEMSINGVERYAILPPGDPIDSVIALRVNEKRK